jgi:DNA ligase (NAD+)
MNWIKVVTIDDLGEALVDRLSKEDTLVRGIADLYKLTIKDISSLEGWGEQSASTIIDNINKTRRLKPETFLAGIGIPGISHRTSEELLKAFKTIEGVQAASKEDIIALKGFSDISAESIVEGLRKHSKEIVELRAIIDLSPEKPSEGKLAGKTFCFTGALSKPRPVYQSMVSDAGGKNLSSVTKDLNYLVCNEDQGSSKSQKAKKYGTKVITEQEFLNLIGDIQPKVPEVKAPIIKNFSLFK